MKPEMSDAVEAGSRASRPTSGRESAGRDTARGVFLGVVLSLAALAQGAHDLWAATAVYTVTLLWLGAGVLAAAWSREKDGLPLGAAAPLALVGGAMWLSWRQAVNPGDSLFGLMDWLCVLGMFFVSMRAFKEQSARDAFLASLVPVLAFEGCLMFVQHLQAKNFFNYQAPGTFPNAQAAVAFALPWIPALALKVWRGRGAGLWQRCYWDAGLIGALSLIPLAECVSGLVLVLLCVPFLAGPRTVLRWVERHRSWAGGGAVLGISAVAWLLWKKLQFSCFVTGLPMRSGDPLMRLSWWASGWKMFLSRPWLGVGPDCFEFAYPSFRDPAAELSITYSHSLVLGLLAETGIIGTASLAVFGAWWLRQARRLGSTMQERWPFALGTMLFLSFAVVNVSIEYLAVQIAIALCMGLAVAPGGGPAWAPRKSGAIAAAALAICSLPWIFQPWLASRLLVEGEAALQTAELAAAQDAFSAAAGYDSRHFEPERGLARVHHARFKATRDPASLEAAVLHQRRATELNPMAATLWLDLGVYLAESGKPVEAWAAVEKAESLDKGRPWWKADVEALRVRMRKAEEGGRAEKANAGTGGNRSPQPRPR
ncbi:MAG: O-antigen ligase family protein [Elusimicrobia bacterium]|nr:O-antigen ligase family protein [Elusimicrobiota bacterium]